MLASLRPSGAPDQSSAYRALNWFFSSVGWADWIDQITDNRRELAFAVVQYPKDDDRTMKMIANAVKNHFMEYQTSRIQ